MTSSDNISSREVESLRGNEGKMGHFYRRGCGRREGGGKGKRHAASSPVVAVIGCRAGSLDTTPSVAVVVGR